MHSIDAPAAASWATQAERRGADIGPMKKAPILLGAAAVLLWGVGCSTGAKTPSTQVLSRAHHDSHPPGQLHLVGRGGHHAREHPDNGRDISGHTGEQGDAGRREPGLGPPDAHLDRRPGQRGDLRPGFGSDVGPPGHHRRRVQGRGHRGRRDGVHAGRRDTRGHDVFGFPEADGPQLANRWISVVATDSNYGDVSAGVTLASVLEETAITGPFTTGAPTTIGGVAVIPVTGQVPVASGDPKSSGTLYVTTGPSPLPVRLDTVAADGSKGTVSFSGWRVSVPLAAPSGAIPESSLARKPFV